MVIRNRRLLEGIETAIIEYNKEFEGDKEIDFIEYSDDGESANIPEEILSKLEILRISLRAKDIGEKELQDITEQLSQMLDVMKLKVFSFSMQPYSQLDISFLDHLNENVERIEILGVDLSKEEPNRFERFRKLKHFILRKCNISNPNIISKIKSEFSISLEDNEIAPEYYEDALKLMQSSNGRIKFSVKQLEIMSRIHSTKRVDLNDYLKLMNIMDFDSILGLTVIIGNEFDFENSDSEQIVNMLNEKPNITLSTTIANISKLDPEGALKVPAKIIIKNVAELSLEQLLKHQCISNIEISDGNNTLSEQSKPYTREEYEKVRREINEIISQIQFPEANDPNMEKKIFVQVYKILGRKIDYDHNAISKEGRNNERLQITSRNLLGGLLENKCVCAGYADILRNVLACTGIYSEYVGAMPDIENGVPFDLNDPGGHAWNLVMLDGKKYWTDLTWDANGIKTGRYPLTYCLKSSKDFKHDKFTKRQEDKHKDLCLESISDEEQVMLFEGKVLEDKNVTNKKESKNIGYLSDCVLSIASSGLRTTTVRKAANEVSNCTAIRIMPENETEVADGRN